MPGDNDNLDIFVSHRSALVDYATPILGCRARAEDVVQDAYLRFSASAGKPGADILHPVAYLYRTVRNLALNWLRRQNCEAQAPAGSDMLDAMPAPAPSPEHEVLYRDELRVMMRAVQELPDRTRQAFSMHRLDGLTLQQVAARLGISVGLAHQLVRDALTHCAKRLDDHD